MTIDTTYFGYGAGLIMVGWAVGILFSLIVTTLRNIRDHV